MIRLVYSNRTERLREALEDALVATRRDPLWPDHVVVPNRNMERHLELAIAESRGVAANLRFHRLERFIARFVGRTLRRPLLSRFALERLVLAALLDETWLRDPVLEPLARYVQPLTTGEPGGAALGSLDTRDALDVRRAQLARRVASLLEGYAYARPELLERWRRGGEGDSALERWQAALWRRVVATRGDALALPEALAEIARRPAAGHLPPNVHVFGLSYVARSFVWAFAELGRVTDLHLYVLNPCMEFWEDVPSETEQRHAERLRARLPARAATFPREDDAELHPAVVAHEEDPLPLTWWGRPGREYIHLCNELTGAAFEERFSLTGGDGVLGAIQRDILTRAPAPEPADAEGSPDSSEARDDEDRSVAIFACPTVRREVETVAAAIWEDVRRDPDLRFHRIAVLVHPEARAQYLPHVTAVFREAQRLPHNVVDLPLATESLVARGALTLLDVLLSRFRRPDVLTLLAEPALATGAAQVDDEARLRWAAHIDRLGIFHGLDHGDHTGTYLVQDQVSWDQGIRRLALGAFMTGERVGDERAFELDGQSYLPHDLPGDDGGPELALLLRSLAADARFVREARLPLDEWSRVFAGVFRTYLRATTEREERELLRVVRAAERLRGPDLDEAERGGPAAEVPVGARVATELLRSGLEALGGSRGEYLADGVVVSALAPMRSIPFDHVYLLGMGEGRFPTRERRDPLDLRSAKRVVGDVSPAERDKYVFLESLLCARRRFVVSWVARDGGTGDDVPPSPVVRQLRQLVVRYTGRDPTRSFPLRRHDAVDDPATDAGPLIEARREARMRRTGERWRRALGRDVRLEVLRAQAPAALRRELGCIEDLAGAAQGGVVSPDDEGPVQVSLASLRRFLEDPLQGWAATILRIDDEDDAAELARLEDEPFRPEALEATRALQASFEAALRRRQPPLRCYEEEVARTQAHGRWPLGVLAEQRARRDEKMLGGWARLYRQSVSRGSAQPRRVRFGPGPRAHESDELRDAITFDLGGQTVELVGHTRLLVDQGRASLVLVAREAEPGLPLLRARLRRGLAGFLDYAALVASEGAPRDGHRALVFFGGEAAQDASMRFGPLDPGEARHLLGGLLRDLLGGAHAYFLPCEAVFWRPEAGARLLAQTSPAELARAIERERRRREAETFARGPIRDGHRYPSPPPADALAIARRRFEAYLRWSAA